MRLHKFIPLNHVNDCYFCIINLSGVNSLTVSKLPYFNVLSATRLAPHCKEIPVPVFQTLKNLPDEMLSARGTFVDKNESEDFSGNSNLPMLILFNQEALGK